MSHYKMESNEENLMQEWDREKDFQRHGNWINMTSANSWLSYVGIKHGYLWWIKTEIEHIQNIYMVTEYTN